MVTSSIPNISPAGSWKGFSLITLLSKNKLWFIKNADTIKALISGSGALIASSFPENPWIKLLFGAGGAYATYLLSSAFQYWITNVDLKNNT